MLGGMANKFKCLGVLGTIHDTVQYSLVEQIGTVHNCNQIVMYFSLHNM